MRRLLYPIVSLLLLAVVLWLRGQADRMRFVVPNNAADVLYASTFANAADWEQQDRRGYVIDRAQERLTLTIEEVVFMAEDTPDSLRSTLPYLFENFDYRVETSALEGPLDNSFGVVFRQADDETHYYFLISSDGYYSVWRKVAGFPPQELSAWIPSDAIVQGVDGETNTLRVVGQGDEFRFFVNGEPLLLCIPNNPDGLSTYSGGECVGGEMRDTLVDDTIPDGKLGVIVNPLAPGQLSVAFDDALVLPAP